MIAAFMISTYGLLSISAIINAALVAPAMIEFGVLPIAAHMFVFYFAIILTGIFNGAKIYPCVPIAQRNVPNKDRKSVV